MEPQFHNLKLQKKKFLQLAQKSFGPQDRKKLLAAFVFAQVKHKGQRRDEGTAYVIHPIRVAITLLEDVGTWDADAVTAALLHDVVEDCKVRYPTLQKRFGKRVTAFVRALTRKRRESESELAKEKDKIKKLAALTRQPLEVQLVKCADLLDNIRCAADVPFYSPARQKFPRWHREFHQAVKFVQGVHPVLFRELQTALRVFDVKRMVRPLVRLGL